jgi:hypothetical protein
MDPVFRELVVKGSHDQVKAFLAGCFLEGFPADRLLLNRDEGIAEESLAERLVEMLGLHPDVTHLVVEESLAGRVREALRQGGGPLGLELVEDRPVAGAAFEFSFRAYTPGHAAEIRRLFADLPPGLRLEGFHTDEDVHPEDAGTEVYTPAHDYCFTGRGRAAGDLVAVVAFRRRLEPQDLIRTETIRLAFG